MDLDILIWLNSAQDYTYGLTLYYLHGKNPNLSRILTVGGATGKNRLTLAYELGKIVKGISSGSKPPALLKSQASHEIPKDPVQEPIPDTGIDKLRTDQKMIYKMLDNLHAIIPYREIKERKEIAFQILELDDRLKEITIRIEHFDKHGIIPADPVKDAPKTISDMKMAELIKRQMTLRTYITRYKLNLKDSKSLKKRSRYQELLDKYQLEMDDINKKLGQ
jgi:hypothetical protein